MLTITVKFWLFPINLTPKFLCFLCPASDPLVLAQINVWDCKADFMLKHLEQASIIWLQSWQVIARKTSSCCEKGCTQALRCDLRHAQPAQILHAVTLLAAKFRLQRLQRFAKKESLQTAWRHRTAGGRPYAAYCVAASAVALAYV